MKKIILLLIIVVSSFTSCDDCCNYYYKDYDLIELIDKLMDDMTYNYHHHNRETFYTYDDMYSVTRIGRIIEIEILYCDSYCDSNTLIRKLKYIYRNCYLIRNIIAERRDIIVIDCSF